MLDGVTTLGVDEHVWHHTSTSPSTRAGGGPKELGVAGVGLASLK
jgi:transposase